MSKSFEQSKDEIARLCQYFTTNHVKALGTIDNTAIKKMFELE